MHAASADADQNFVYFFVPRVCQRTRAEEDTFAIAAEQKYGKIHDVLQPVICLAFSGSEQVYQCAWRIPLSGSIILLLVAAAVSKRTNVSNHLLHTDISQSPFSFTKNYFCSLLPQRTDTQKLRNLPLSLPNPEQCVSLCSPVQDTSSIRLKLPSPSSSQHSAHTSRDFLRCDARPLPEAASLSTHTSTNLSTREIV